MGTPKNPPCDGFAMVYPILCDLYEVTIHEEVLWDIDNTYFAKSRKHLPLSDFSHLPPRDLLPIVAALELNSYFEGFSLTDIKLSNDGLEVS